MGLFTGISKLDRCEILALTDSISLALAEGLNSDDQNMLGNLLVTIGSVIMTFASSAGDPSGTPTTSTTSSK